MVRSVSIARRRQARKVIRCPGARLPVHGRVARAWRALARAHEQLLDFEDMRDRTTCDNRRVTTDPIYVYEEHGMWHVDYGGGVTQDFASEAEAVAAAEEVAERESREVRRERPPAS
jgi:hypothetical protein